MTQKTVTKIYNSEKLPQVYSFSIDSNPFSSLGKLEDQAGYIKNVATISLAWYCIENYTVYLQLENGAQATHFFITRDEAFQAVNNHLKSLDLPEIIDRAKDRRTANLYTKDIVEVYEREEEPLKSFTACVSYTHEKYPLITKEVELKIEASCKEEVEYLLYNCDSYQMYFSSEGYVFRDVECITL